jgi:hypothetical protein
VKEKVSVLAPGLILKAPPVTLAALVLYPVMAIDIPVIFVGIVEGLPGTVTVDVVLTIGQMGELTAGKIL